MQKKLIAPVCAGVALLAMVVWFAVPRTQTQPAAPLPATPSLQAPAQTAPQGQSAQPSTGAPVEAEPTAAGDTIVLVIRHAEKPEDGPDLNEAGQARAAAYVNYFEHYAIDGHAVAFDHLFACADSKGSVRPRETITPLSRALNMPIDQRFSRDDAAGLAQEIGAHWRGKSVLICWHHGDIPDLLTALGADPKALIHHKKWPGDVFNWVVQLVYDTNGKLIPADTTVIDENLMPGDAGNAP